MSVSGLCCFRTHSPALINEHVHSMFVSFHALYEEQRIQKKTHTQTNMSTVSESRELF